MLDIKLRIEYSSQSIKNLNINADSYNRISAFVGGGYENSSLQTDNQGYRRFILGKSIVGSDAYFSSNYNGLWANVGSSSELYDASDATKGYKINNASEKYSFTLTGEEISHFKIVFDSSMNIYPKVLAVNGRLYYNNNIEFECFDISSDNITVDILSLNDSNVPVVINSILFDTHIVYDRHNGLMEIKRGSEKTADNVLPQYGIVGQYGHAQFIDYTKTVENLIKNNKLSKVVAVTIYNGNMVLGKYETSSNWDYNVYSKEVSIDLQDRIMKWQDVRISKNEISYNVSASYIYNYLLQFCDEFTFSVDKEVMSFWSSITVPYFYLEDDTLWNQWGKFLNLTQSVLYTMSNGEIKIVRSR